MKKRAIVEVEIQTERWDDEQAERVVIVENEIIKAIMDAYDEDKLSVGGGIKIVVYSMFVDPKANIG